MPTYSVIVGATEVKIVSANKVRTSLVIANGSAANTLFIKDGGSGVSVLNGLPVPPNGQASYRIPEDDPTSSFFAIASGAGTRVIIQEQLGRQPLPVRVV